MDRFLRQAFEVRGGRMVREFLKDGAELGFVHEGPPRIWSGLPQTGRHRPENVQFFACHTLNVWLLLCCRYLYAAALAWRRHGTDLSLVAPSRNRGSASFVTATGRNQLSREARRARRGSPDLRRAAGEGRERRYRRDVGGDSRCYERQLGRVLPTLHTPGEPKNTAKAWLGGPVCTAGAAL